MSRQPPLSSPDYQPLDTQKLVVGNYWAVVRRSMLLAVAVHVAFGVLGLLIGAPELTYLQIVSVVVYAACYFLSFRGDRRVAAFLTYLDLLGHSTLAGWILGPESGFQFYSWILLPLLFTNPYRELKTKLYMALGFCVLFLTIDWALWHTTPVVIVSETALSAVRTFNIGCYLLATALAAIFHAKAVNDAQNMLRAAAETDALTGLLNRRRMSDRMQQELVRARSEHKPLAVMLLDIDHFKNVNDRFGHALGDEVIAKVGDALTRCVRRGDLVSRWGGEEFLVLMPGANETQARDAAERMRLEVAATSMGDQGLFVSITIGIALWRAGESLDETLDRADTLLYRGKNNGRNCVVVDDAPKPTTGQRLAS